MSALPPSRPLKPAMILRGIQEVIDQYDFFILDIWGVLHNGIEPFPGTIDCLARIKNHGKQILLVSNTPSVGATIKDDLSVMNITPDMYDHIVTAGDSARADVKARAGQRCWCAGQLHENSMVAGLNINYVDHPEHADYMINAIYGNNESSNNRQIDLMRIAAEKNLDMICPNPDKVVQVGNDLKLCPGTFAEIYEAELGGTVYYHGKPHAPIYETAYEKIGRPDKARILAIGDSLHTDIQGANNFGIDSVFNLVGIHKAEFHAAFGDTLTSDILATYLERAAHCPDMVLEGLQF